MSLNAAVGDSVQLSCMASGDPPLAFTWRGATNEVVGTGETLSLLSVASSSSGIYSCTASNLNFAVVFGETEASSKASVAVTVLGMSILGSLFQHMKKSVRSFISDKDVPSS